MGAERDQTAADKELAWADLLWREWEYRHSLYWKSLYLWGGAALAITLSPFWRSEVQTWGNALFIFPLTGWLVAAAGTWHLRAEAARLQAVTKKYDELREAHKPEYLAPTGYRTWRTHSIALRIGSVITYLFAAGFTYLAVLSGVFLWAANIKHWSVAMWLFAWLTVLLLAGTLCLFEVNRRAHNRNLNEMA